MDEPVLLERAVLLHDALASAGIPHAYGGDLALLLQGAQTRGPRALVVHVTVDPRRPEPAFTALPAQVAFSTGDVARAVREGQVRLLWPVQGGPPVPLELFLPQHPLHAVAAGRTTAVPLLGTPVPVLSATDLVTLLALYDRSRDWADIEELLGLGAVDVREVSRWLSHLVGADDPRLARLRDAAEPREIPVAAVLFKRRPEHLGD